ncbi:hypothetical protein G7Y89_g5811 [Cudoniella acicularis]|uniref:Uncharacterized protein n=1 Tax=Cudoniella acicularis TaxID=354080 RepID=A0A8H4RQ09_9HELO|nr:hypothetical protein G7Y89_g5811 [Cudoniella acicularis]
MAEFVYSTQASPPPSSLQLPVSAERARTDHHPRMGKGRNSFSPPIIATDDEPPLKRGISSRYPRIETGRNHNKRICPRSKPPPVVVPQEKRFINPTLEPDSDSGIDVDSPKGSTHPSSSMAYVRSGAPSPAPKPRVHDAAKPASDGNSSTTDTTASIFSSIEFGSPVLPQLPFANKQNVERKPVDAIESPAEPADDILNARSSRRILKSWTEAIPFRPRILPQIKKALPSFRDIRGKSDGHSSRARLFQRNKSLPIAKNFDGERSPRYTSSSAGKSTVSQDESKESEKQRRVPEYNLRRSFKRWMDKLRVESRLQPETERQVTSIYQDLLKNSRPVSELYPQLRRLLATTPDLLKKFRILVPTASLAKWGAAERAARCHFQVQKYKHTLRKCLNSFHLKQKQQISQKPEKDPLFYHPNTLFPQAPKQEDDITLQVRYLEKVLPIVKPPPKLNMEAAQSIENIKANIKATNKLYFEGLVGLEEVYGGKGVEVPPKATLALRRQCERLAGLYAGVGAGVQRENENGNGNENWKGGVSEVEAWKVQEMVDISLFAAGDGYWARKMVNGGLGFAF